MFIATGAVAQDATWLATPGTNVFGTGTNWSTGSVPTGRAIQRARFGDTLRRRQRRHEAGLVAGSLTRRRFHHAPSIPAASARARRALCPARRAQQLDALRGGQALETALAPIRTQAMALQADLSALLDLRGPLPV